MPRWRPVLEEVRQFMGLGTACEWPPKKICPDTLACNVLLVAVVFVG